jgi:hypothetical protein
MICNEILPVELLHSHTITLCQWSSGSNVCFLPRGAMVRTPGVHPNFWNWDFLLAMSRYIGDLDVIPD